MRKKLSPEEIEKDRERVKKEIAKVSKFLSAERHTHPDKVTDREINLLNDLFSIKSAEIFRRLWHADNITKIMRPTIERIPSKEQIEALMNGPLPAFHNYWPELYNTLDNDKGKELAKNIIKAAATVTKSYGEQGLLGFYKTLLKEPDEYTSYTPQNDFAKNPEMRALMLSRLGEKIEEIKSKSDMHLYDHDFPAVKEFLRSSAFTCKDHLKGISQCRKLIKTIHNVEENMLREKQENENNDLEKIFSYNPPVKSLQKE